MKFKVFLTFLLIYSGIQAQTPRPVNGVPDVRNTLYALTDAIVHTDANTVLNGATVLVQQQKIVGLGINLSIPPNAIKIPLKGRHIYPAFIDCSAQYGLSIPKEKGGANELVDRPDEGPFAWNMAVHPEVRSVEQFNTKQSDADRLRKLGFSTVCTQIRDGLFRGTAPVVSLANKSENEVILLPEAATGMSFNKGTSRQEYPSSFAGSVALIRQTLIDAQWYGRQTSKLETNLSYDNLNRTAKLPVLFEVNLVDDALKAAEIGKEFGLPIILEGSGDEYQRTEELKAFGYPIVIPINFPEAYDVSDPYLSERIPISALLHWEFAPANPAILHRKGIPFAITSKGINNEDLFLLNLRKAAAAGLNSSIILDALTRIPAKLLGISNRTGELKPGFDASFIVFSDSLLHPDNQILENWSLGDRRVYDYAYSMKISGQYHGMIGSDSLRLTLKGKNSNPDAEALVNGKKQKAKFQINGFNVILKIQEADQEKWTLSGILDTTANTIQIKGNGTTDFINNIAWFVRYKNALPPDTAKEEALAVVHADSVKLRYPLVGFGYEKMPLPENLLIKNATVWTNESEGIIQNGAVLISAGKIVSVGSEEDLKKMMKPRKEWKELDGKGKHITAGIIDEHSHIALSRGVNEGTQNNTAEVRMSDALNPNDIDIYRQLAGGVVAAQLLHGSANPIGGQSALIKFRWGKSASGLIVENAPKHIKFALGENVKQSNWGDQKTTRFPQTRMGVEQVYYDAFLRAREYKSKMERWKKLGEKEKRSSPEPARDLELEAIAEIIDGERNITCHSYVQSEINMLMHVGDSMGFKVNTFTHILEGYKVADKMKAHGANASSFSDWWAYKWEVNDAIPYNGAILHKMGINTGFNSDDAEMGRRLNQEAAKAVLYGGVSEEEALKFVTLNPAKMLKIDSRTGSLKAGKDADLVVWNNHPLSIYAKPEKTFVDGICFFDLETDKKLQNEILLNRKRILEKMKREKSSGKPLRKPKMSHKHYYTCEDLYNDLDEQ